jgi:hypothetical protein
MKLFTFIQSHNKSATLITTHPSVEKSYRPGLLKLNSAVVKRKKDEESLAEPVQMLVASDLNEAVTVTSRSRFNNNFTLVHTSLEKGELDCKAKLKDLDKRPANSDPTRFSLSFFCVWLCAWQRCCRRRTQTMYKTITNDSDQRMTIHLL